LFELMGESSPVLIAPLPAEELRTSA